MIPLFASCLVEDDAQDMIEYSLLVAFVICTMAGLILGIGDSIHTVTNISKSQIDAANDMLH